MVLSMSNENIYSIFRSRFPLDLSCCWLETDNGVSYSWNDLEQSTARIANLLFSLDLDPHSRVAAHVDKSPEALMLYLATLRAGFIYLPLNTAYRQGEMSYFLHNASPAVVVCSPNNYTWIAEIAGKSGVKYIFTLEGMECGNGAVLKLKTLTMILFRC